MIIKQDRVTSYKKSIPQVVASNGKHFKMYKFRTMKKGSHDMREELEELNKNDKAIFKIENDPK